MSFLKADRRVLVLALARMADSIGNSFLIIVLPLYVASNVVTGGTFGLSTALITGLILSAFGFFNSLAQPIAGRLSDRSGKRRIYIVIGLLILTVANFAYSLAGSYSAMLFIRIFQGIGVAFTIPASIALVNDLADDSSRGGDMGVFNTFRLLGFGIGPIAAGTVVHAGPYDWPVVGQLTGFDAAFYIAAAGALISAVLVLTFVADPETVDEEEASDDFELSFIENDQHGFLDPVFTLGIASLFVAISIALLSPLENKINATLHQGPTMFGVEFAAFLLSQVVVQTPIGSASDRYGRKPFIIGGLLLLIPATLAQGLVVAPWQMVIARLAQGIAASMAFTPAFALAGDLAKRGSSGTTLSILTMSFGLGTAIGPLASGYLVSFGLVVPFAVGAALAALGAVLVYSEVRDTVGVEPGPTSSGKPVSQD